MLDSILYYWYSWLTRFFAKGTDGGMDIKKIFFIFLTTSTSAFAYSPYIASVNIGLTNYINRPASSFVISPCDTDTLHDYSQNYYPSWEFSVKRTFLITAVDWLSYFDVGPAVYYQKDRFKGDVWELNLPQFNNYRYAATAESASILAEGDLFFQHVFQIFYPFLSFGMGVALTDLDYHDEARPRIQQNSDLHVSAGNFNFIYQIGAGISMPFNPRWIGNLHYSYIHVGEVNTGMETNISLQQSIRLKLNSHNLFFGVSYRV